MDDSPKNAPGELDLVLKPAEKRADDSGAGYIENVFVVMNETSSRLVLDYSGSDTSRELAGILLGTSTEKDGQYRVNIEAAIEARYTDASRGSVTFTHRSWDYINRVREEKFPSHSVVGWFHTHPGFGIFLSAYDKFIHHNFFNLPFQVAYVVDPLSGRHGFFGWQKDNLVEVPFKAPYDPRSAEVSVTAADEVEKAGMEQVAGKKGFPFGKVAVAASIAVLLFSNGYFLRTGQETAARIEGMERQLQQVQQENEDLRGFLVTAEESLKKLESNLAAERGGRERLQGELEDLLNRPLYLLHTVAADDTLSGISEKYLGDPGRFMELAVLNRLKDPNLIITGETILVPFNRDIE